MFHAPTQRIRPFSRDAERSAARQPILHFDINAENALRYEFVGCVGTWGERFPATNSLRRG